MHSNESTDDPAEGAASFACRWRLEGREAASVGVSGEVDLATARRLDEALHEALGYARLVVLDLRGMSFMDSTGLRVILDTVAQARTKRAHIVLTGASAQVERLIDMTGTRGHLEVLDTRLPEAAPSEQVVGNGWTPFDNDVNDRVLTARVMDVSVAELWMQAADGTIHRPWSPETDGLPVPAGSEVELYLDADGAVNGWYEPRSGLAINQRRLEPGEVPASPADLACQGPCGLVWLAPAAARLAEHHERCLTCAGTLVHR